MVPQQFLLLLNMKIKMISNNTKSLNILMIDLE